LKKSASPANTPEPLSRKRCFAPVVDDQTRLLILGSLPGTQSLVHNEYYAHPQNRFWTLMSEIVDIDLRALDYSTRLQALLASRIGLWDVVAEASREGSLDSRICDHVDNDLMALVNRLPHLIAIAFNGGTAARLGLKVLGTSASRYQISTLPSSSPAYTLPYAQKLLAWRALRDTLGI
jgi:hypoxanthine-DNA glycosylase